MDATSNILLVLAGWYVAICMMVIAFILVTAFLIIPGYNYLESRFNKKVRYFLAMVKDKDITVNYNLYPYKSNRFEIHVNEYPDSPMVFDASSNFGKLYVTSTSKKEVLNFNIQQTDIIVKKLNKRVQKTLKKNELNFLEKHTTKPTYM